MWRSKIYIKYKVNNEVANLKIQYFVSRHILANEIYKTYVFKKRTLLTQNTAGYLSWRSIKY